MAIKRILLFDIYTTGHHGYYSAYLSRYLLEKGYKVMFITCEDERTKSIFKNIPELEIEYVEGNPHERISKSFVKRNIQLFKIFKKGLSIAMNWKANIIHFLTLDYNILPLYPAILKLQKHNIVCTLWWPYFISYRKAKNLNLFKKAYYKITSIMLKHMLKTNVIDLLFVHSANIKELINLEFKFKNFFDQKIVVIPDPVVTSYGQFSIKDARKMLNLPEEATIMLYFGILNKIKGIDILLESIANIKGYFYLVIAGRPVDFSQTDIDIYKKKLDEPYKIIDHIGYIPEDKVNLYFLSADVVVIPYRKSFLGTSGVLQRACGAGKPVIATDVGEVGKAVRENNLGIVVEPESVIALREGILNFLTNKEKIIKEAGKNALEYANKHSVTKTVEIVESAYLKVFNKDQ